MAININITSPQGVRLATERKYCEEDIQVVPVLQSKTVTANGTITPDSGNVGLSQVIVNVPILDTSDATATASDILDGEIAYVNGERVVGTMSNNGGASVELNSFLPVSINEGYYNGTGHVGITLTEQEKIIPGNIKKDIEIFGVTGMYEGTDTSDATATASDLLNGETAYVNGVKVTGTMATYNGEVITVSNVYSVFIDGTMGAGCDYDVYDGTDTTGTLLGVVADFGSGTFNVSSGNVFLAKQGSVGAPGIGGATGTGGVTVTSFTFSTISATVTGAGSIVFDGLG